jgi:hypothetical protein
MSDHNEQEEVKRIRGLVKSGAKKMLALMHYELDTHFNQETGKPEKKMSEATTKKAKIVFDQIRRDYALNGEGVPIEPSDEEAEASIAEATGKTDRLSKLRIVSHDSNAG